MLSCQPAPVTVVVGGVSFAVREIPAGEAVQRAARGDAFWAAFFKAGWPNEPLGSLRTIGLGDMVSVAIDGDRPVGAAMFHDECYYSALRMVFVVPEHRRKGLAFDLITAARPDMPVTGEAISAGGDALLRKLAAHFEKIAPDLFF